MAAGHGGARVGSGRRPGGISQAKRVLLAGLQRGLAQAAELKGLEGSEEELATQSVAHIASDMILAGQGRDVLAIMAQAAPKSDEGGGDKDESPLVRALRRLPGLLEGPPASRADVEDAPAPADAEACAAGPTDPASVTPPRAPFFAPQAPLLPADIEPRASAPRSAPGDPPPPPPGPALRTPLGPENFEKNREPA